MSSTRDWAYSAPESSQAVPEVTTAEKLRAAAVMVLYAAALCAADLIERAL